MYVTMQLNMYYVVKQNFKHILKRVVQLVLTHLHMNLTMCLNM